MKKLLILALTLISTSLQAQTYTQMQWGINKGVNPYRVGANINGTWSDMASVSPSGVWTLFSSGLTPITAYTACNGAADDSAGFVAAAATNNNIYIPTGSTCTINTNTTIPIGSAWTVQKGATINVASGRTLKFRALFQAGRYSIFGGAGAVVGIAQSKPEWWGAIGTFGNTFNSQPAFQAAVNSASAAYESGSVYSDTNGTPAVDIGQGFFNLNTPVDIYPTSSTPLEIRGIGPWNSGTWIQTNSTFTGYALFLVHGYAYNAGQVYYINFKDLSLNNPTKLSGATAGIRYVPEGDGYILQALQKSSLIENVKIANFPIGIDVVNTFKLKISRVGIQEANANLSDNTGIRFYANGPVATGNAMGEIVVENAQIDACPVANASSCSNTINIDMESLGGATVNSINFKSDVLYSANTYVKMVSTGKDGSSNPSWLGDIWFAGDGNQMDGFGCNFIDANASDSGQIFDVHVDHVYHTGASSNACIIHNWNNAGTGAPVSQIFNIWDTNNQFVMGNTSTIIRSLFADRLVIQGNTLSGNTLASDAIALVNTANSIVSNNIIKGEPNFRFGITLGAGTTNTIVTGNECKGTGGFVGSCIVDSTAASTTTNNRYANSDGIFSPILFNNDTSGTITIKAPNSGALGSSVATLPINTGTLAELNFAQAWTANQTFGNTNLLVLGSSTGATTISSANAGASNYTATLPANTGAVAELNFAQSWTANQTFGNTNLLVLGSSTGATTISSNNAGATNYTATLPSNNGTIAELNLAQTWTAAQSFSQYIRHIAQTIATLPTCDASSIGAVTAVSDGTAYATGTYGSAVSATGAVTRQVMCTNTAGATTYAWAYN